LLGLQNLAGGIAGVAGDEAGRRIGGRRRGGGKALPGKVVGAGSSVAAGGVKSGLHGAYPSLSDLTDGDFKHTVDFRSIFAAVAQGCWGLQCDFGLRQPQRLSFL
jgi:hypothetical protein